MSDAEEKKSRLFQRLIKKADSELETIQVDHLRTKQALSEVERNLKNVATVIANAEQALRDVSQSSVQIPLESITAVRDFIAEKRDEHRLRKSEQAQTQQLVERFNKALLEKMLQKKGFEKLMHKHKQKFMQKVDTRAARETELLWLSRQDKYYG